MKQVKLKVPHSEIVPIDSVSKDKYYGFKENIGEKGLIMQSIYGTGAFKLFASQSITQGNHYGSSGGLKTLKAAIDWLLMNEFEVYEFDTPKTLFAWLAE